MVTRPDPLSAPAVATLIGDAEALRALWEDRCARFALVTMDDEQVRDARAQAHADRAASSAADALERSLRNVSASLSEAIDRLALPSAGSADQARETAPVARRRPSVLSGLMRRLRRRVQEEQFEGPDLEGLLVGADRVVGLLADQRRHAATMAMTLEADLVEATQLWRARMRALQAIDPEVSDGDVDAAGLDEATGSLEVTLASGENLYMRMNRHVALLDALAAKLKLDIERGVVLQMADAPGGVKNRSRMDEVPQGGHLDRVRALARTRRLSYADIERRRADAARLIGEVVPTQQPAPLEQV